MDFTIRKYRQLLKSLHHAGFFFQGFDEYVMDAAQKFIILRHDVDKKPENSLSFAKIQNEYGIRGTYYFRIVPESFQPGIIKAISDMGHEIGYHYETMDTCRGNVDEAYDEFRRNLETFRKLVDIKTISMHGSPLSKYDNRDIWKKYSYRELGIIAEPYFDLDFDEVFYITDTGRRWDGHLYNVRDKATNDNPMTNQYFMTLRFRSTDDIVDAVNRGTFPEKAMMNFHPQRWNDALLPWAREWVWQNIKNQAKRVLIAVRS